MRLKFIYSLMEKDQSSENYVGRRTKRKKIILLKKPEPIDTEEKSPESEENAEITEDNALDLTAGLGDALGQLTKD